MRYSGFVATHSVRKSRACSENKALLGGINGFKTYGRFARPAAEIAGRVVSGLGDSVYKLEEVYLRLVLTFILPLLRANQTKVWDAKLEGLNRRLRRQMDSRGV